ncbi:leucine-rich repeat neuronal protein 4 [Poecilia reticulata]|uniref:leucine-rich repeat neuronal protein 4 n=1 Tax=Poecilia reticulata TaxID=8081 RepID=UPI0004A4B573|nr:PREDICTED: leucine-rich repeat neuronal protein 4-like [Poecilia reticulata]XP_008418608.1 PREDICTED: leucine-rich repeat neuronal protein 4-like [Poecilia reticulata]
MGSLCGNLAVLLLFLSPLMHSHLFARASTSSPPITRKKIIIVEHFTVVNPNADYEDFSIVHEVVPSAKSPRLNSEVVNTPCEYNSCLENQEPCEMIKAREGCLCPGVSDEDRPPHAPRIETLQPITTGENAGKIEVQWCAPDSVVSSYKVTVEGSGNDLEFGDGARRATVGSLEVGTKVCVEAINKAGHSSYSDFSCKRYERPESLELQLLAGVIGGGIVLILLLIIVAVVLCRRKMCQKAQQESVSGLGNPSYKSERAS